MKKFLVVFGMFFALSSFANNSLSKKEIDFNTNSLEVVSKKLIKEKFDAPGWYASCYVTITNSETGATRKIYAYGYGATPSAALSNCGENATVLAEAVVKDLNSNP
uniref:hypothetical protein n=1 Tax=Gelidibacter sp. TaxID=2018083 RepID=UPI00404B452C